MNPDAIQLGTVTAVTPQNGFHEESFAVDTECKGLAAIHSSPTPDTGHDTLLPKWPLGTRRVVTRLRTLPLQRSQRGYSCFLPALASD